MTHSGDNHTVTLLAIDLGLRSGLAGFTEDGTLVTYWSRHFSNRAALKQAAYSICNEFPNLSTLAVEGGGDLAVPWQKEARRRGLRFVQASAEAWRQDVLFTREQRSGRQAKLSAEKRARQIIDEAGLSGPTSFRHDTAEAIVFGSWVASAKEASS